MRQKHKQPTLEVRTSPIHGRGVFATSRIARGTLIGTYEGVPAQRDGRYVLWIEEQDGTVVGTRGTNDLRFLNHSHTPNAVFRGTELYARRAIEPGSELTIDYGEEWAEVDARAEPKRSTSSRARQAAR